MKIIDGDPSAPVSCLRPCQPQEAGWRAVSLPGGRMLSTGRHLPSGSHSLKSASISACTAKVSAIGGFGRASRAAPQPPRGPSAAQRRVPSALRSREPGGPRPKGSRVVSRGAGKTALSAVLRRGRHVELQVDHRLVELLARHLCGHRGRAGGYRAKRGRPAGWGAGHAKCVAAPRPTRGSCCLAAGSCLACAFFSRRSR